MNHLRLGASLYVPATRTPDDLAAIGRGTRYPALRSVIFCTEDAVRADEVDLALDHLAQALPQMEESPTLRFVRVRTPEVMARVLALPGIRGIDGFVLPKSTCRSLPRYLAQLSGEDPFLLMPTLETAEVFEQGEMIRFRDLVSDSSVRGRILALRIGGNDLLHLLGIRRSPRRTIYDTALGPVIAALAGTFLPAGFGLTAPVFEGLAHPDVLQAEVQRDLDHGLIGKTAVHPDQIAQIEACYAIRRDELEMARAILAPAARAVFRMHDTMCEGATHSRWARTAVERAEIFGVVEDVEIPPAWISSRAAPLPVAAHA